MGRPRRALQQRTPSGRLAWLTHAWLRRLLAPHCKFHPRPQRSGLTVPARDRGLAAPGRRPHAAARAQAVAACATCVPAWGPRGVPPPAALPAAGRTESSEHANMVGGASGAIGSAACTFGERTAGAPPCVPGPAAHAQVQLQGSAGNPAAARSAALACQPHVLAPVRMSHAWLYRFVPPPYSSAGLLPLNCCWNRKTCAGFTTGAAPPRCDACSRTEYPPPAAPAHCPRAASRLIGNRSTLACWLGRRWWRPSLAPGGCSTRSCLCARRRRSLAARRDVRPLRSAACAAHGRPGPREEGSQALAAARPAWRA